MFGKKSRNRRAGRRDERRAHRASKKEARQNNRVERAGMRQSTRMTNADGRQTTKQSMVSAGMNPNAWVSDVTSGVVGVANAASSYGQAKALGGLSPEAKEAQKREATGTEPDSTLMLAGAAAAAYFLLKK